MKCYKKIEEENSVLMIIERAYDDIIILNETFCLYGWNQIWLSKKI